VERDPVHQAAQGRAVEPAIRPEGTSEHDDGVGRREPRGLGVARGEPLRRGREGRYGQETEREGAENPAPAEAARRAAARA
jgi:hypothetical protein